MAGIVFHFEQFDVDVFSGRQIDLDAWRYACKAFGVTKMRMIDLVPGGAQVVMNDSEVDFKRHVSLDDFFAERSGDNMVFLETPWTFSENMEVTNLCDFQHPTDKETWYIFGPSIGFRPMEDDGRTWVTIQQEGRGAMHSVHVAVLLLNDLYCKQKGMK